MKKTIIGLVGKRRVGKDTAGQVIIGAAPNFALYSFAQPIKEMLRSLLAGGRYPYSVNDLISGVMKEEPCDALQGKSPRFALQTLGTEWGRNLIGPDIWVDAAMSSIADGSNSGAVVTDVRFHNEADAIKKAGGCLIKILKSMPCTDPLTESHESERGDILPADYTIVNSGTLDDFKEKVLSVLAQII